MVVEDLDDDELLAVLEQRKLDTRASERGKLRLAAQWCVRHPATADTGVATWGGASLPGVLGEDESLGGAGTPAVSAFAPEPAASSRVPSRASVTCTRSAIARGKCRRTSRVNAISRRCRAVQAANSASESSTWASGRYGGKWVTVQRA